MKQIELLAPAGSFESLHAAIQAGANAIYFGVEQLNMRTRSSHSFTVKDIKKISTVCKAGGIKAYLTLNTVMYEHDMQLLKTILKEAKKQSIDAVIASDFSVLALCGQMQVPVHISTQANISNVESVKFFAAYADVMVLARELTLQQVKNITAAIRQQQIKGPSGKLVRIEVFVHGALCMAISGKCYLSLHAQNASANRGACIQNCRRPYIVRDAETGEELEIDNQYIMSSKDLCTIDILDQVIDSGVEVLKIEGRGKGADYVHTVTQCYREAVSAVNEGTYSHGKVAVWKKELEKVYNRGFWEGYYLGRKLGEWTSQPGSAATEKKIYVGKGTKYYPRKKIGEFIIESGSLKQGDRLMVMGRHFGMIKQRIESIWVNGREDIKAVKGEKITLIVPEKLMPGDKLYKVVNEDAKTDSLPD